jgi:IclR family acetate operon transcriptional repressor
MLVLSEDPDTIIGTGPGESSPLSRRVRSAERVAAVLDLLRRSPQPLRHVDVATAIELPKSSTSNLLDTLVGVGLVRLDDRGYSLGIKLIELGAAAAERLDIRDIARPTLRQLSELGIGTSNLAILQGHEVLYIEKVNNPEHVIQIATRVGGTVPAHMTALGKVMVAALPLVDRERWLREHEFVPATEHTITSVAEFKRALKFATSSGYAFDDEEQNLRTVCVAAPIRDHMGATVAAISLTCLSVDVASGRDVQIAAVVRGAEEVSGLLGASRI